MTSPLNGLKIIRRNSTVSGWLDSEPHIEARGELSTIDADKTSTIADQSIRSGENIIETNAKTDLLNNPIGVFGVDVILDCLETRLFWRKVFRFNLD